MGVILSWRKDESLIRHKEIEKMLKEEYEKAPGNLKLLLLGAGDSGKSTIVKQMRILHTGGFSEHEIDHQRFMIIDNTIKSICDIIRGMENLSIQYEHPTNAMASTLLLKTEDKWTAHQPLEFGEWLLIKALWSDSGVQQCFRRSNEYFLIDSAKYFLDNVHRISMPDYRPTYEDILHSRSSTIGIVEITFPLREGLLTIIDVGGQRSQRKKWIHCFEDVQSLIFIAALSEYNQVLFEDENRNRMKEALQLFDATVTCQWFIKTPIILFLNKTDLFREKLPYFPLAHTFPSYKGGQDFNDAASYIESRFQKSVVSKLDRFYTHRTCATDTRNVEFVMEACFDILFSNAVKLVKLI